MNRPRSNAHPPAYFIDPQLVARVVAIRETIWLRIASMQTNMGDHGKSMDALERVIRINSANLHALTQVGTILAKKERYVMAIGHLQRAISINASCGEAWVVLGHCHVMKDELPIAYEAYQNALNLRDPSDPNLWYGIGLLYDRYGSHDNALEAFLSVLRRAPHFEHYVEVCFCIGVIYKEQRKLDQAMHYLNRVRAYPSPPIPPLTPADIWYQIGHVNELREDIPQALKIYKLALNDNPRHSKTLQHLGWLEHTKLNNSRQATVLLRKSLDVDQTDAQTWYLLGRVHMGMEEFKEAYDSYQQAVYRDGRNSTYWCSFGALYSQMNQFKDAMDAYARAIRLNPSVSEVWFDLGTLYERTGRSEDAIMVYQRAVELASDKNRRRIRERIQLLQVHRSDAPATNSNNQSRHSPVLSLPMNIRNLQRHQHPHPVHLRPSLPRLSMQLPLPSAPPRSRPQASAPTSIGFYAPHHANHLRSSMPLLNSLPVPSHSMQPTHHSLCNPQDSHLSSTILSSRPLTKLPFRQPFDHINGAAADGKQKYASLPRSASMPRRRRLGNTRHTPRLPPFRMHSLVPLGQNASRRGFPGSSSMMTSGAMNINMNSALFHGKKLPEIGSSSGMRDFRMNDIAIIAGKDASRTGNGTHTRKEQRSNGHQDDNFQHSFKKANPDLPVSSVPTVSSSSGSVNVIPAMPSMPLPIIRSAPAPQRKGNKKKGNTSSITPRFGLSSLLSLVHSNPPNMSARLPLPLMHASRKNIGNGNSPNGPIPMPGKYIPAGPESKSRTVEQTTNGAIIDIPRFVPISSLNADKTCNARRNITPKKETVRNAVIEDDKLSKRARVCETESSDEGKESVNVGNSIYEKNTKDSGNKKKESTTFAPKNQGTGDKRIANSDTANI